MPPTHQTVTAPEGRKTPIASSDGCEPGGGLLYVEAGTVARVRCSGHVRRSIDRGDLIPCTADGKPVELEQAGSPEVLKVVDETGLELELEKIDLSRHRSTNTDATKKKER